MGDGEPGDVWPSCPGPCRAPILVALAWFHRPQERKRLVVTKAIELSNFKNDPEWETTIGFLRERGALLSEDEPRRLLWCREDAMRDLNNHIVAWRTANPSLA